jgi:hypothetical protein
MFTYDKFLPGYIFCLYQGRVVVVGSLLVMKHVYKYRLFFCSEKPFNLFLDTKRDPKEIQEEVLKKKLKRVHPFKGQLDGELKFPNAHGPQRFNYRDEHVHGTWRLREIERERLRQGVYKDMDWTALRQDPTNA